MSTLINKKGISSVVAMSLLIVLAIISIISFQTWFKNYESVILADTETTSNEALQSLAIDDLVTDSLYIVNDIEDNLSIIKLQINNATCSLNSNLNLGMNTLNISDCITNLTNTKVEIVLITPQKVLQKSKFVKNLVVTSSSTELSGTFISIWNTSKAGTSNSTQITLPLESDGTYNFNINWGDGSSDTITTWNQAEVTHNYDSAGEYQVNITGQIQGFRFNDGGDKRKIIEIQEWGPLRLGNNGGYFYGCIYLQITATDNLNLIGTTLLYQMFENAIFFDGNLSNWDVSSVTNMNRMFYNANLFNGNITNWNVSNVLAMARMFELATTFNQDISNWDVSKVTTMEAMFQYANAFNQDISNWNVDNVTDMQYMFRSAIVFNQNISSWDVSKVTIMRDMFKYANTFNQDISDWNVGNVTNMIEMFQHAVAFNQNLSSWDVDQVTLHTDFDLDASSWVLPKPNFS